jgi:hypothetical protein
MQNCRNSWCSPPAITDTSGNHTSGPLDPENDGGKAKLIAVLSCLELTSAADLLRAGSMHNKSATLC